MAALTLSATKEAPPKAEPRNRGGTKTRACEAPHLYTHAPAMGSSGRTAATVARNTGWVRACLSSAALWASTQASVLVLREEAAGLLLRRPKRKPSAIQIEPEPDVDRFLHG